MSNQFPPAGDGQDKPQQPDSSQGYGQPPVNTGYNASAGGYQGYQPQSNYQGYGSYNGGENPAAQPGQAPSGQPEVQPGQPAQPQPAAPQAFPGQPGYGQPPVQGGYGQQPVQPGQYAQFPGQQPQMGAAPKKKGVPVWLWVVIGVVVAALIGGGIWGSIMLFGKGADNANGYTVESKKTVSDVKVDYTGSWDSVGGVSGNAWANSDSSCYYVANFHEGTVSGVDANDVEGSFEKAVNVQNPFESSMGSGEITSEGKVVMADMNGVDVEYLLYKYASDDGEASAYAALHPFSDSGDMLYLGLICDGSAANASGLKEQMAQTKIELIPEEKK